MPFLLLFSESKYMVFGRRPASRSTATPEKCMQFTVVLQSIPEAEHLSTPRRSLSHKSSGTRLVRPESGSDMSVEAHSVKTEEGTPGGKFVSAREFHSSSQTARATLALREMLVQGELRPGEKIREVPLSAQLNVSRIPLHLALERLENEGFLEVLPKRGFRVSLFSVE